MTRHLDDIELQDILRSEGDVSALEAHVNGCAACARRLSDEAALDLALLEVGRNVPTCPVCGSFAAAERCDRCGAALAAGDFFVDAQITANAHGRVYLATAADGSRVALKELVFVQAPTFAVVDAFGREGAFLQTLSHPSIPRFRASFTVGEGVHTRLYLAQEYIEGASLGTELTRRRFTEAEVIDIADRVLVVLEYLQSLAPTVIHRDVKPDNLVRRKDGSIVLVDFGAARDIATTRATSATGTFGYMPIEQHAGLVGSTTDVYALGMTMIHLLARKEPWSYQQSPERLRELGISAPTRRWLAKATAPRPEDRFADAAEARAALKNGVRRARRPARRTMLLLAAALAVGGAAYAVGSRWGRDIPPPPEVIVRTPTSSEVSIPPVVSPPMRPPAPPPAPMTEPGPLRARAPILELAKLAAAAPNDQALQAEVAQLAILIKRRAEAAAGFRLANVPDDPRLLLNPFKPVRIVVGDLDATEGTEAWTARRNLIREVIVVTGDVRVPTLEETVLIAGGKVEVRRATRSLVLSLGDIAYAGRYSAASILAAPHIECSGIKFFETSMAFAELRPGCGGPTATPAPFDSARPWFEIEDVAEVRMPAPTCATSQCALFFSRGGQTIRVPGSDSLAALEHVTVEAWVRLVHLPPGTQTVIAMPSMFNLYIDGTHQALGFYAVPNGRHQSPIHVPGVLPKPPNGRWMHLAATHDGNEQRLYLNGVAIRTTRNRGPLRSKMNHLVIGSGVLGEIDEVRVWSYARTQAQIAENRSRSLTGDEPGLLLYLQMNEGHGDHLRDSSRYGNDAYLGEAPGEDPGDPAWSAEHPFD